MLLGLQQLAHGVQAFFHAELFALFQAGAHAAVDPPNHFRLVLRKRIEDAVHSLPYQGIPVQLNLIVRKLAYFARKGLERLLEETVYGADRECSVVMEHVEQDFLRGRIGHRTAVQVADNPALHLRRGLVGEGHRQHMAVLARIAASQDEFQICFGKIVCLARTGTRLQYLHRPQMVLKSHISQVRASSVLLKGTEVSESSPSRASSLPAIRELKSGFSSTLSTGFTKRRLV